MKRIPVSKTTRTQPLLRLAIFAVVTVAFVCLTSCGTIAKAARREVQPYSVNNTCYADYTISTIKLERNEAKIILCLSQTVIDDWLAELDATQSDTYYLDTILQSGHNLEAGFSRDLLETAAQTLTDNHCTSIKLISYVNLSPPVADQFVGSTAYLFLQQDLAYFANLMEQEGLTSYEIPTSNGEETIILSLEEAIAYEELSAEYGIPIIILPVTDPDNPLTDLFKGADVKPLHASRAKQGASLIDISDVIP